MATIPKINLKIPQGTTYTHDFKYVDASGVAIPLTGYSVRMQFRVDFSSPTHFHEATTSNGGFLLDEAGGVITLIITHDLTTAFTEYNGVYDIEIVAPNNVVTRIVKGSVTIDPEVTK